VDIPVCGDCVKKFCPGCFAHPVNRVPCDYCRKEVINIIFILEMDQDPDLSYLGEFSLTAPTDRYYIRRNTGELFNPAGRVIGRRHDLSPQINERFQPPYFIVTNLDENCKVTKVMMVDAFQDWRRAEQFDVGVWYFVGVVGVAIVIDDDGEKTIYSPGIWGVESDSDIEHLTEMARDEFVSLVTQLNKLGFDKCHLAEACSIDFRPQWGYDDGDE
jgi:hypothetical protein